MTYELYDLIYQINSADYITNTGKLYFDINNSPKEIDLSFILDYIEQKFPDECQYFKSLCILKVDCILDYPSSSSDFATRLLFKKKVYPNEAKYIKFYFEELRSLSDCFDKASLKKNNQAVNDIALKFLNRPQDDIVINHISNLSEVLNCNQEFEYCSNYINQHLQQGQGQFTKIYQMLDPSSKLRLDLTLICMAVSNDDEIDEYFNDYLENNHIETLKKIDYRIAKSIGASLEPSKKKYFYLNNYNTPVLFILNNFQKDLDALTQFQSSQNTLQSLRDKTMSNLNNINDYYNSMEEIEGQESFSDSTDLFHYLLDNLAMFGNDDRTSLEILLKISKFNQEMLDWAIIYFEHDLDREEPPIIKVSENGIVSCPYLERYINLNQLNQKLFELYVEECEESISNTMNRFVETINMNPNKKDENFEAFTSIYNRLDFIHRRLYRKAVISLAKNFNF